MANVREERAAAAMLGSDTVRSLELREINREPLFRNAVVATWCRADDDPDVVEFSFSSEEPVERYFGMEVLSHEPGAMNMARLNSGAAPWLWNHNPDVVLGGVEKAWQGDDGRGMVRTRWSPNTKSEGSEEWKVRQNWEAGIIRNVSFMYSIDAPLDVKSRDGVALVTAFTPMEVSTVSIPADHTVGQGRAIGNPAAPAADQTHPPTQPVESTINLDEVRAQAAADERTRVSAITGLCRTHAAEDLAQGLIERGASEVDAMREVLAAIGKRNTQPATPKAAAAQPIASGGGSADIGLTDKEARSFSFLKAMRAQLFPNERQFQEDAAFEREASKAAAERMGMSPKGLLIPNDVLSRALTAGTAATAGDLIFTDARPGSFIELLRKRNFLTGLGVTILSGLTGPVGIPKQTGASQVYWKGEGVAAAESEPSVGQVTMTLKEMSAWTRFSRSLMLQSSIDVETFVRNDIVTVMALEQARVALYGLGSSSQPEGLKITTGINTKDFNANQPTYAELVDMETLIAADDADIGTMGYVTNATIYGGFKTTEKAVGTAQFVLEPGGTVNSYNVVRSNQVEAGDVFFGVWSQLVLGLFGAVDLQVNPYSEDKEGNIRVVAHQAIDYAVRHPQAFCRGNLNQWPNRQGWRCGGGNPC
jgi:HK97 family phage major capsid protein